MNENVKNEVVAVVDKIENAMWELCDLYDKHELNDFEIMSGGNVPFHMSLDELAYDIRGWKEKISKNEK